MKPNGKLNTEALEVAPQLSWQRAQDAPPTLSENKLLAIWREVLNNPKLGVKDDFFDCGGDFFVGD